MSASMLANKTFVELTLLHPSPVHFTLLLVITVILACFLLVAICVLCNVGGTLDCIYAARRQRRALAISAAKNQQHTLEAGDASSHQPLLPVVAAAPIRSTSVAQSARSHQSFRAQSPPSRSSAGKFQTTRPFGEASFR